MNTADFLSAVINQPSALTGRSSIAYPCGRKLFNKWSNGRKVQSCTYYRDGSLKSLTDMSGKTVCYECDSDGRLQYLKEQYSGSFVDVTEGCRYNERNKLAQEFKRYYEELYESRKTRNDVDADEWNKTLNSHLQQSRKEIDMLEKKKEITIRSSTAEYLTYVAAVGDEAESMEMRYEDENIWLTQKMMARGIMQIIIPLR